MGKRLFFFIAALLLPTVAAHAGSAFSVMTPPDKASVESRSIAVVVSAASAPFDSLQVSVDGRVRREVVRPAGRKVICVDGVPLSVGINRIFITAFKGKSRVDEQKLSVMVRSDLSSIWNRIPSGYRSYSHHGGEGERACLPCHDAGTMVSVANPATPEQSGCYVCHKQMIRSLASLHGPTAVWSCIMCHNPKQEGRPPLAADDSQCVECHDESINAWQKERRVHGPLAVGSCTACHSPHGSDQPSFAKAPVFELCTSCHEGVIRRHHFPNGVAHNGSTFYLACSSRAPGNPFACTACHSPHAAQSPYLLRNARETSEQPEYCQSCHTHIKS